MGRIKIEYSLEFVKPTGERTLVGNFNGFAGLTQATLKANDSGVGIQASDDEVSGKFHAHIMEFRDDEHYNDIYLI